MIYEVAVVCKGDQSEDKRKALIDSLTNEITTSKGEVLLNEDWGLRSLAHYSGNQAVKGYFYYIMYSSDGQVNKELTRRLNISEAVLKHMNIVIGKDAEKENLVKNYKNPFIVVTEASDEFGGNEKQKRFHSKKKICWFKANKIMPDWKNPTSISWLINEFGKISPARVTGVSAKYQRMATKAVKQARCIGIFSPCTGQVTE